MCIYIHTPTVTHTPHTHIYNTYTYTHTYTHTLYTCTHIHTYIRMNDYEMVLLRHTISTMYHGIIFKSCKKHNILQ